MHMSVAIIIVKSIGRKSDPNVKVILPKRQHQVVETLDQAPHVRGGPSAQYQEWVLIS